MESQTIFWSSVLLGLAALLALLVTLEFGCFGTRINLNAVLAILGIVGGAVLYGGADPEFNLTGYSWLALNIVVTSLFQVYNKWIAKSLEMNSWELSQANNLLSLPILLWSGCNPWTGTETMLGRLVTGSGEAGLLYKVFCTDWLTCAIFLSD